MSNVVVITSSPARQQRRNLALLHVMYGVGSTLGTLITGEILGLEWPWVFSLLVVLPLALILGWLTRSLGEKIHIHDGSRRQSMVLSGEHWLIILIFSAYVAGEVLTSMWMTAFLVEAQHLSIAEASRYPAMFFIVMATSRALLVLLPSHWGGSTFWLFASLLSGVVFLGLGLLGWNWCLPMVGLLGPFYPLLLSRASQLYPEKNRTIAIYATLSMQIVLCLFHLAIGQLSQQISIGVLYWITPASLLLAIFLLIGHVARTRKMAGVI